jgi:hypothetical protein
MKRIAGLVLLLLVAAIAAFGGQTYTRGVGVYPGNPAEDNPPVMVPDQTTYRNLALHRPAYSSSSYDYNLTAQLVTDGIKDTKLPRWVVTTYSQGGVTKKNEREFLLDHNSTSNVNLGGPEGWVQFELAGGISRLEIDRISFQARFRPPSPAQQQQETSPGNYACIVSGSEDGQEWDELGRFESALPPPPRPMLFGPTGSYVDASVTLRKPSLSRIYRIIFASTGQGTWTINDVQFSDKGKAVEIGGPYNFTSAWMP